MSGEREIFGRMPDGTPVERVRLRGASGFEVAVITYGAAIQSLHAPDGGGTTADVVLGHDELDGYLASRNFFGATIGRYANRIAGGRFELGGQPYQVPVNDGPNALHGGPGGFDTRLFAITDLSDRHVRMRRTSPAGEEGFPGTLEIDVTFAVAGTALTLHLEATGDADTVVNLTNHSFFDLSGDGDILGHTLRVAADSFLPVDAEGLPTGEIRSVTDTPFDFREAQAFGARIRQADEQLLLGRGYDHNFCLAAGRSAVPIRAASLADPVSGRILDIETSEPGLQVYSGNFLDSTVRGKAGRPYRQSDGCCLEPQAFPDSPNRPDFPSSVLKAGETYRHRIHYRFSAGRGAPARNAPGRTA